MNKKKFTAEAIKYFNYLSMPDMHPQGNQAVFVKTAAEEESGEFHPRVFEWRQEDTDVTAVAGEAEKSKRPLYSPDGKYLAYLSDQSGEFQIYIRKEGESKVRQLTTLRHGITYFDWAGDSSRLVFAAPLWMEEVHSKEEIHAKEEVHLAFREMTAGEKSSWLEEKEWEPVVITEIDYKNDDCFGIRDGSLVRIGTVSVDGIMSLLPVGEMDCAYPVFSPDGKQIAFYGKPYEGVYASSTELFLYRQEEDEVRQITRGRKLMLCPDVRPLFSGNGELVYVTAYYEDESQGFMETLYEVDINNGTADLFFRKEDALFQAGIHTMVVGRSVYGEEKPYFAIDYEKRFLYYINAWQGRENLYRVSLLGERTIEAVYTNGLNVHDFCLPVNGGIVFLAGDLSTLAELYRFLPESGELYRLTFSNAWMEEYEWAVTEELWIPTCDGKERIQVWIVHPVHEEAGKRYPAVLDIHGGPECTYVADFWHEFQAIAAADMVCVCTNPRGSAGYGLSFSGNEYAWNQEAVDDLLLAVQTAVDRGITDPDRLGVTGGSYGGYMTYKLISQLEDPFYFKAAAAQRGLANLATSYGTGDIGFISKGKEDVSGIKMLDVLTERARRSLIRNVDKIKTPLLLLHGYQDYRCTFEQSEQMFIAMKERNAQVPVRLVMFPGENHGITRTGKLSSQIRHLQELVEWFKTRSLTKVSKDAT